MMTHKTLNVLLEGTEYCAASYVSRHLCSAWRSSQALKLFHPCQFVTERKLQKALSNPSFLALDLRLFAQAAGE